MGARRLTVTDPDKIVEDMPEKTPVGRERRKAEYRAERAAAQAAKSVFPAVEPYPGHMPPEAMFPEWDFVAHPEGPSLDDPAVMAYCELQWKLFLKHAGARKNA